MTSIRHTRPHACAKATKNFVVEYEAFAEVDLSQDVWLRWYILESDARPVASVAPQAVQVAPLPAQAAASKVWPRKRRAAGRHPPRPKQGPLGAADAALEDAQDGALTSEDEGAMGEAEEADFQLEAELHGLLEEAEALAQSGLNLADAEVEARPSADAAEPSGSANAPAPIAADAPSAEEAPPPPAMVVPRGVGRGERSSAIVTFVCPGGTISYYTSKNAFEAVCDNKSHRRCVATRSSNGRGTGDGGFPRAGRPVGFLAAWLGAGEAVATKEDHWRLFEQPLAERVRLRGCIADTPSGRQLLSCERPRVAREPEEPTSLSGYR